MNKLAILSIPFIVFHIYLHPSWAENTFNAMTLDEKIGQLFMVATIVSPAIQEEKYAQRILKSPCNFSHQWIEYLIKEFHIGGITYLCKGTSVDQLALTNHFQQLSKVPLLFGLDAEWGLTMRLYDTIRFPRNMALGALPNTNLIYQLGLQIGKQCKALGVHINFAPVVDINSNPENPIINVRSFGEDKNRVVECAIAYMHGIQDAGILACAKHFPGHGDTFQDSHLELPTVAKTKDELFENELYPFVKMIEAGVDCIMNAHLRVPALDKTRNMPASLSSKIIKDLLQDELGFTRLCITDGMDMKGVGKYHKPGYAELKALCAGNDIILCPVDVPKAFALIKQALEQGILSYDEFDAHVLKILRTKEKLNLHECCIISEQELQNCLNSNEAYALKKLLFTQSITTVNQSKNKPLIQHNEHAIIIQCGGYLPSEFEKTMQTQAGIKTYHLPTDPKKELADFVLSKVTEKETIIFAFLDMNRSAEKNYGIEQSCLHLVETLRNQNKNIIIALFGTPYSIAFFEPDDAFVIAYEDDPDAQIAAAEVLLGKIEAMGTLPIEL